MVVSRARLAAPLPAFLVSTFLAAALVGGRAQAAESQTVAIHVYPEDSGAQAMAGRTADTLARRASTESWKVSIEPRIAELLDRAPDDLVRAADSLIAGRAAYAEGLEQNSRLRLEQAQEALLKARASFLESAAAPPYGDLRNVHLYLGVISLNLGQPDTAASHFRQVQFLAPQMQLKTDVFPPSVVEAFNEARRGIGTNAKGSLRVESDVKGALIIVDGVSRGSTPRLFNDVPEGPHYLEIRAPGSSPHLQAIEVTPGIETPVVVNLKSAGPTLRQSWTGRGEAGGAAIARILGQDRLVLASVRTTVAGVSPYAIRGAAFDAASGHKIQSAEVSTTKDQPTTDERLGKFAETLFRIPRGTSVSLAATSARRALILDRDSALLTIETGLAYQSMMFDGHGRYVSATNYGQINAGAPDHGFKSYLETRTRIHARYGLRERVTFVIMLPFYTKELHYRYDDDFDGTFTSDEEDVKRDDVGIGDIITGADVRMPRFERGPLSIVYISSRVKLPTGSSTVPSAYLRQYQALIMGSGQFDIYAGAGTVMASDNLRFGAELGYNARLPDRVWYYNDGRPRRHLNIGDEEHLKLNAAWHMSRSLAPEVTLDFTHRHATQRFVDPISHDDREAREMYLANLGFALKAEFSETANAGVVFEHPVWGKTTTTFFPLDVTGPRLSFFYGRRF